MAGLHGTERAYKHWGWDQLQQHLIQQLPSNSSAAPYDLRCKDTLFLHLIAYTTMK